MQKNTWMQKNKWHIRRDGSVLTLSRDLPARFDLAVTENIYVGRSVSRGRLAQQIRQDMWRALQNLRGFSPVVQVRDTVDGVEVIAGGAVVGPFPRAKSEACVSEVLTSPVNQARWLRFATRRSAAGEEL